MNEFEQTLLLASSAGIILTTLVIIVVQYVRRARSGEDGDE